jgi:hypothetical protein
LQHHELARRSRPSLSWNSSGPHDRRQPDRRTQCHPGCSLFRDFMFLKATGCYISAAHACRLRPRRSRSAG